MSDSVRTEAELVAAFRAGDRTMFAHIYDRYAATVFSYFMRTGLTRAEAADATYDALLDAASRLETETPEDLETWLLAVAYGNGDLPAVDEIVPTPMALRPRVLNEIEQESVRTRFQLPALSEGAAQVGIFVAVTIVVGLIGLAVAARFEPVQAPPTPPTTTAVVAVATTSTTTVATTTTTVEVTTTAEASTPPEIEVSTETIDFGSDDHSVELDLVNTGGGAAEWLLAPSSPAISVSPGQGELPGGESVTIEVSLDRDGIEEGDLDEIITVTWTDGEIEVSVTGSHEDNPTIHNPQASPSEVHVGGDCTDTHTTISARVRDTSPLESVVVRWSPDGHASQETEMSDVGDDRFEATIGPFTATGTVEARVVAFDVRGNAGGATTTFTALVCPDD